MKLFKIVTAVVLCGSAVVATPIARASCLINITVTNGTNGDINILPSASKSKRIGGTWRRLTKGGWFHDASDSDLRLSPGESISDDYLATSNCTRNRRYYLRANCVETDNAYGPAIYVYAPSRSGKTKSQSINAIMEFTLDEWDCI
ncbi:MAG: hypothetical protein KTR35_11000 [Gammaproteobacteria bacterium]|nr:hypothetical protein [Gammaproteobacteria bacterium]